MKQHNNHWDEVTDYIRDDNLLWNEQNWKEQMMYQMHALPLGETGKAGNMGRQQPHQTQQKEGAYLAAEEK